MELDLSALPRVIDVGGVRVETSGDLSDASRAALVASWSPGVQQSRSTTRLIAELQRQGYPVVLCSTSEAVGPLRFHPAEELDADRLTVLRRPNIGYDFGSWAVMMDRFPQLLDRDRVLVVNDSLVGPFASLTDVIADFESTSADVWGMTESGQFTSHLQSFFRGFRYGSLAEPVMRDFWADVRVIDDKRDLIAAYEYGFAARLREWHFSGACFVDHREIVSRPDNPTLVGWRRLLDAGVPFVKRELVCRPELAPDGGDVPAELARRYGVDLADWL